MTLDDTSFPKRLTKIDHLTRCDHPHLRDDDNCYFLGEYTARKGFAYSATNNLIINFKKPMDRRASPQWKYKGEMIHQASTALFEAIGTSNLQNYLFVPVPPSKVRGDEMYDDRMMQMLNGFAQLVATHHGHHPDIRELVEQTTSTSAAHDTDNRPSPDKLADLYKINTKALEQPIRDCIVICDDVLTTGCHYRAMTTVISEQFPNANFRGVFLARRVPQAEDF